MFDISWTEFLLIGVVALIVIGPKELPAVLRTLGQYTRKVRSMAADFQSQFQEAMREAEMADLKKQVEDIATDIKQYDPLKDVRADLEAAGKDIQASLEQPRADDVRRLPLPTKHPRRSCRRPLALAPASRSRSRRKRPSPSRRAGNDETGRMSREEEEEKRIEATKAPLMDHLIELRGRLIKAIAAFALASIVCFFFAKYIFNVLTWPYLWVAGAEFEIHLHRAARILCRAAQARAVRRGVHFISGGRFANLYVRRAGALPQRAACVSALSHRDADLLLAGLNGGLFPGVADAGALFAQHAAVRRAGSADHRAVAESRGLSRR